MFKHILLCLIFCGILTATHAQNNSSVSLSGTVVDQLGHSLTGVVLQLDPDDQISVSSLNGNFFFSVTNSGEKTLHARILGFKEEILHFSVQKDTTLNIQLSPAPILSDEVVVSATRVSPTSGIAYSEVGKEELNSNNTGQDIPYLLQLTPSAVATSDAGNGIGYTGLRIRGSDPTRTNITVNGIPLNDAESQQVYWVDLPDLAASTENIQIQRGAGSSTNGAGAFGASINILTNQLSKEPFCKLSSSAGSFNTLKNSIQIGTGLLEKHFSVEGRFSNIHSNGYIDRGTSDLESMALTGTYSDSLTIIRISVLKGKEVTYQCWNGVPISRFLNDHQGMLDYISRNGLDSSAGANLLNSGRTYNEFTYSDQIDNYRQNNYQLSISRKLSRNWLFNLAFHYTRGIGFYEEFQAGQKLSDYGIVPSDTSKVYADLVRRKWLDNDFYGSVFSAIHPLGEKAQITIGAGWNRYIGGHYGEVIRINAGTTSDIPNRYYDDDANKEDMHAFIRYETSLTSSLSFYTDIQSRVVHYSFAGLNDSALVAQRSVSLSFFNPKAGLSWKINKNNCLYLSFSSAAKEPGRDDYVNSSPASNPKAEFLYDTEAGYRYERKRFAAQLNGYFMYYKDQLVLTGKLNDVGNYTRTNVPVSFRRGLEFEAAWQLLRSVNVSGNLTISENQIRRFSEYVDSYTATDTSNVYNGQQTFGYSNTPIAFSPKLTGMMRISWKFLKCFETQFITRYVGDQFLDNTGSSDRKLADYTICDLHINCAVEHFLGRELNVNLAVNNLFNRVYTSNGYTWGYLTNAVRTSEVFVYPQAGTNIMCQVSLKF